MVEELARDDVRAFFDNQQGTDQYTSLKAMTRELDREAARYLNEMVRGDALSVGGMWDFFSWGEDLKSLTVLDLSPEMLKVYCPEGATGILGDLYDYDFEPQSFDSIIFSLILHHTPQTNWRTSVNRVERALDRAQRWLRPGGHVFIFECCPVPPLMWLERAAFPLTKRFLEHFGQPPVVMYSKNFYEELLNERFGSCDPKPVDPKGFNYWKWYPVFMGIRWLRVPFVVQPKMHVVVAPAIP